MAGRRTNLGAQVQVDPGEAKRQILAAAVATRGCVRDMARMLEVSECTLHRHISKLGLRVDVRKAALTPVEAAHA